MFNHTRIAAVMALACAAALPARALQLDWAGRISFHNDVVQIDVHLDQALEGVGIWTDSFLNGANFDPIVGLWAANGSGDYSLMAMEDDCPCIKPAEQTYFDAGIRMPTLAAGDYRLTVVKFYNWPNTSLLGGGFSEDGSVPRALVNGGEWKLHLADGFTFEPPPPPPIPEPASALLLLAGLGGLSVFTRGRRTPA